MASSFAWLDYSERERRQVRDVLDLFREQETGDELGIGQIRDAFADLLFPGTTTIMTRARYFLFVPWIYLRLEQNRVPAGRLLARLREEENRLTKILLASHESDGVIGRVAGDHLQRLPSNIYWLGLRSWGIRLFPGGQAEYHRSVDSFYASIGRAMAAREDAFEEFDLRRNWHGGLPPAPPGFPVDATLALSLSEATYLCERIAAADTATGEESLLGYLARKGEPATVSSSGTTPSQASSRHTSPVGLSTCAELLRDAARRRFALQPDARQARPPRRACRGVPRAPRHVERRPGSARRGSSRHWDRADFWRLVHSSGARTGRWTVEFVDAWLDIALTPIAAPTWQTTTRRRR